MLFRSPTSTILDAGFIMGLDAEYAENIHSVWLAQIKKIDDTFEFVFATNATAKKLSFFRSVNSQEWTNEHAESFSDDGKRCAVEPVWSGFIVTGNLAALSELFVTAATNNVWTFGDISQTQANRYLIEPGLIQNLNRAYLRSISVGNYSRVVVPPCGSADTDADRTIVPNALCLKGDIRLKEGYNCEITQTDRSNELSVTALFNAGAGSTSTELCAHGSEVPFYVNEPLAPNSKFYSGGPACNETISSINGFNGPSVNIVGGVGVNILADSDTHEIIVQKKPNSQVNCT